MFVCCEGKMDVDMIDNVGTVVNICTANWSLYVPYSGHYMYRTVVTVCTPV